MSIGILLGNLGTPESPQTKDVGVYLKEFLMDPFVIDKPYWFRWLLVNAIIVPFRSPKSAHAYSGIWKKEGSPLLVHTLSLKDSLQKKMGAHVLVEVGMRYGQPSIGQGLKKLSHCEKIVLLPLYPQYAESSYETWRQKAEEQVRELKIKSSIEIIPPFYKSTDYLVAQTELIKDHYDTKSHLLLSYHGLPIRHLKKLDPSKSHCSVVDNCCASIGVNNKNCYRAQCVYTSNKISEALGLDKSQWSISFQSGFGRDPWTEPNTESMVDQLLRRGVKNLTVATPAFTADCLESLEEIGIRLRERFMDGGGHQFRLVPCLNNHEQWVIALHKMLGPYLSAH